MRERHEIDSPLWVDYQSMLVPPLKFFLQTDHQPTGVLERQPDGIILSHQPWYTEITVGLEGLDADAVYYALPQEDSSVLLVACLDEIVDPFFALMCGHDFGDELTQLVALRWPEQYAMLRNSQTVKSRSRMLLRIATPMRMQWVVADDLRGRDVEEISSERLESLAYAATETFVRMSDPAGELPGVVDLLGGPDRFTRRLGTVADILFSLADVAGVLTGSSSPLEVFNIARSARGIVDDVKRDWTRQ